MTNTGASGPARPAGETPSAPSPVDRRPWGVWASLAFYLLFFEVVPPLYDVILKATGLRALVDHSPLLGVIQLLAAHGIPLLLFVLVVCLTSIPVCDYFGWTRPRTKDVVLGIAVILALFGAVGLLVVLTGNAAGAASDYRAAIAAGTSPWWYVLRWWPAMFLAPIVEESVYRGFLWRGLQYRLGNWAALRSPRWCSPQRIINTGCRMALSTQLRWCSTSSSVRSSAGCAGAAAAPSCL